jgi:biotin transport system substrate-specific component
LGKGMPLWTALTMTVFPFIGFDLIKVAAGVFCGIRIQKALRNAGLFLNE